MNSQPQINLFDPALQQCPYEAYKQLRDEAPVYNIPGTQIYVVSRYDHVREVLMDPARFPSTALSELMRASPVDMERGRKVAERFREKGWLPAPTLAGRDDP
ncbi:MAG: cytochrome P450, partial [Erythrobacter sp.]|nr:cytochrome P450 [Erythrobacter sp.]